MMKGYVFDIQRFSVHDGPGIRTIVFLKGCSLFCPWCSSPETQSFARDILFYPERCLGCGSCYEVCSEKAVRISAQGGGRIDRSRCTLCGRCAENCYSGALRICGERKNVEEISKEIERDRVFYSNSGGGVTISGGEPLQQIEFTTAVLQTCKAAGFHTALETSGVQSWELFRTILPYLDLLLFDLKQMDPEKHKKLTGVSNELILNNLKKALATGVQTIIRFPVIPGLNDQTENIISMCKFLHQVNPIKRLDLLPYHQLGEPTYGRLGRRYLLEGLEPKAEEELVPIAEVFGEEGFEVQIGG